MSGQKTTLLLLNHTATFINCDELSVHFTGQFNQGVILTLLRGHSRLPATRRRNGKTKYRIKPLKTMPGVLVSSNAR